MRRSRFEAPPEEALVFLADIEAIFRDIDHGYQSVAESYAFHCRGCEDTCCRTHFYHHTFLEYFLLRQGFRQFSEGRRCRIVENAQRVCRRLEAGATKVLCPLNTDGLCSLYRYRPMICRMHGIPHKLHHPVRGWILGPGCEQFPDPQSGDDSVRLDRTPFYRRVARLEQQMKAALDLNGRIRMTVAEMITTF